MVRIPNLSRQQGFSMIEALFSALILGIALLALAGFQAVAMQDSSLVKARTVASSLAQEKLDDLRSFTFVTDGNTSDDSAAASVTNYCGQGTFCFSEIAANAGGQENADGSLVIPTGSVSGYLDNYTRTWTVTCSAEAAVTAFSFSSTCNSTTVAKLVTVTISWTDSKGTSQSMSLQSVIYAMDPSKITRGTISPASTQKPQQSYTPIGVPDAVPVPISTGDGKYKESSKPLPDVSSHGYSLRTEFDSVSYTTADGSSKKDSQLEFATVNCVCEFAGTGSGYPASYFYWDGSALRVKTPSAMISKVTGTAPAIQGDSQDSLCDSCCRDHHDSEAPNASNPETALYDPNRPSTDYAASGNHKHYYYADSSDPAQGLVEVAESAGNRYLEACRFARINGFYRLLQDWRALDMVVMPYNNYLSVQQTLQNYQDYLVGYLKYQAKTDCTAAGASGCSGINQSSVPSKSDLATRNLSNQAPGQYNQLLARALYADRVYSSTQPRTLDATYYAALATKISAGATWLDLLPFNEVNVTLLANWASSNTSVVTVTNESIADISATAADYYGVYSRGLTRVQPGSGGNADITAYLLPSNSGLTGGVKRSPISGVVDYDSNLAASGTISYAGPIGVDRDDHRSGNRKSNSLNIARASNSSTTLVSGDIRIGNSSATLATSTDVTLTGAPSAGITCTVGTPIAGVATYSCTVNSSYSGTLSASTSVSNAFFDVGGDVTYDTESAVVPENSCSISTGSIDANCKNFWVFGPIANVLGKCNGPRCDSSNVVVVSKLNGTGADVACTISSGVITCPVTLNATTKTWTGTFRITNASGKSNNLTATSTCSSSSGTNAKTTGSISAGPADKQSAFNMCATDRDDVPPAAPTLSWVGSNPKTLSWSAVDGATDYRIYTCMTSTKSSLTACTPGTLVSTTSSLNYDPQDPAAMDTVCVAIKSRSGTLVSGLSSVKCVYLNAAGTTYTYQ